VENGLCGSAFVAAEGIAQGGDVGCLIEAERHAASCGLTRGKVNPRRDERNSGPALSDVRRWPLADRQLSGAGPKKAEI